MDAVRAVRRARAKAGGAPPSKSTVYRFLSGKTFPRGRSESRGRPVSLTPKDVSKLEKARKRLLHEADSNYRVVYADIIEAAGLEGRACQRTMADALRQQGVGYRRPREKIFSHG